MTDYVYKAGDVDGPTVLAAIEPEQPEMITWEGPKDVFDALLSAMNEARALRAENDRLRAAIVEWWLVFDDEVDAVTAPDRLYEQSWKLRAVAGLETAG